MKKRKSKLAVHFSSAKSDWATPQALFDDLNTKYGPFQLDVCATKENAKCPFYYTKEIPNGLLAPRYANAAALANGITLPGKPACWMNPPYGREIGKWVKKAYDESARGCVVVCLLPARTDTRWFHDYCYRRDGVSVEFLRGRVKFGGAKNSAPFPSMVVVFGEKK